MQGRGLGLERLADWMCAAPAHLGGLRRRKGQIAVGCDADLVVFDPEAEFVVSAERLYFRHAVTPYLGERLRGVVRQTVLRGETVFNEGTFPGAKTGREVPR